MMADLSASSSRLNLPSGSPLKKASMRASFSCFAS